MRYFLLRTDDTHTLQARKAVAHILERTEEGLLLSACNQLTDIPGNCLITEKPKIPVCRSCVRCHKARAAGQ
jgi:hypothetical protein